MSEAEVVSAHASHINHWPIALLLLQDWTSDVAAKSLAAGSNTETVWHAERVIIASWTGAWTDR